MKIKNNSAATFTLAIFLAFAGGADAAETPEQVYEKYFTAVKQQGVAASADFIHPDELLRFKQMLWPIFENGDEQTRSALIQDLFGKNATIDTVKNMPPADFYRGFMKIADVQSKSTNTSYGDTKILGSVNEGDVIHLVTRPTVRTGGFSMTRQEVISLKPYNGSWKLLLAGKLEGIGKAVKASVLDQQRKATKK